MVKLQIIKEVLIEILDENKGWVTMSEIKEKCREKYPSIKICTSPLIFLLKYTPDVFINNVKNDSYKLVKHASQDDIISSWSTKDIIYYFLDKSEIPKHIDEITEYIKMYKTNITRQRIMTPLYLAIDECFVFFENNKFGISNKTYSSEYVPIPKRNNINKRHPQIFLLISKFLENRKTPIDISDIMEYLLKIYPDLKRRNVISSLRRNKEKLRIYKNSYFGLASYEYAEKWDEIDKKTHEKTITELATECLAIEILPKHLSEITDYILNVRPEVNKLSVMSVLKNKNTAIFRFFENKLIGLQSKTYSIEFIDHKFRVYKHIAKILTNYFQKEDNPKSIYDIYNYMNTNFHYSNKRNLKMYLSANKKFIFIKFKNNYFGLASKNYSNEYIEVKKNVNKKPMNQIVSEYLSKYKTPKHKSEIIKYILKHKLYSNQKSIRTIIRIYENIKFRYFENGFIGLIDKEYTIDYVAKTNVNKKKNSIDAIIQAFLQEEKCPVTINTLVAYVLKQKPFVQIKSIENILSLKRGKFRFFENNFIGLKGKEYAIAYIEKEKKRKI